MPRQRVGEKGHKEASEKWKKTMKERHGDITAFMAEVGRKGGLAQVKKGFGYKEPCDCDVIKESHTLPRCRGVLGGRKSRRGKK